MKPFYNIIFCIFACNTIPRYSDEIKKAESTYLKDCESLGVKALFFLAESKVPLAETQLGNKVPSASYIYLENVADDYLSAADKQFLGIKYAHDNYDYNYLFVCGTDTYVVIPRLVKYLAEFREQGPCIIGGHGDTRTICGKIVNYLAGGAGLILNRELVICIYDKLTTMQEEWMHLCINNDYIQWIPSCDLALCYFLVELNNSSREPLVPLEESDNIVKGGIIREPLVPLKFHYTVGLMYGCNYQGNNNTPHGLYPCCTTHVNPDKIISCHNMSPQDFDAFYKYLQK